MIKTGRKIAGFLFGDGFPELGKIVPRLVLTRVKLCHAPGAAYILRRQARGAARLHPHVTGAVSDRNT